MSRTKFLGAALSGAFALTAIASATGSAALPEFSPAKGAFTATSGAVVFKGAVTFKCSSDTIKNGAITGAKTETATLDLEGCEFHSSGDVAHIILVPVDGELCYLNEAEKLVGTFFTVLPETGVTIEGAGVKLILRGTIVGTVEPLNKKQTTGTVGIKKPNIVECGAKTASLLLNINGGAFSKTELETTESITFAASTEVKA